MESNLLTNAVVLESKEDESTNDLDLKEVLEFCQDCGEKILINEVIGQVSSKVDEVAESKLGEQINLSKIYEAWEMVKARSELSKHGRHDYDPNCEICKS